MLQGLVVGMRVPAGAAQVPGRLHVTVSSLHGLIKVSNDLQPSQQINTSESLHYRCPPVCLSEHLDPRCYLLQWLLAASLCKLAGPLEQQILAPSCAARDYCPLLFLCGL